MRNVILSPVMQFNHIFKGGSNYEFESNNKLAKNKDDFLYLLKELLTEKKYPAGCESKYNTVSEIMPGHAYSLLEVNTINIDKEKLDVVKIFNP